MATGMSEVETYLNKQRVFQISSSTTDKSCDCDHLKRSQDANMPTHGFILEVPLLKPLYLWQKNKYIKPYVYDTLLDLLG